MKYLFTICLVFLGIISFAQAAPGYIPLLEASEDATIRPGEAIIYGGFIQRIGFSSGGYSQYLQLINTDTKKYYSLLVKPETRTRKTNIFVAHIPAGNYAILNYQWTRSTWYGHSETTEPVYKGVDSRREQKTKAAYATPPGYFVFKVVPNTINYVGTWHFDTGIVSFSNEKAQADSVVSKTFTRLNFPAANITLPY